MNNFSPIYGQNPTTGTQEAIQTDGAHHLSQAVSGPSGNPVFANVFAGNELRVHVEPKQLFLDDASSGSLDTTNRWKTPTASGGGVAATISGGTIVLGTGTTANGYSFLESAVTFPPVNPGWLLAQSSINLPSPYIANTYLFWGLGTSPGTPTAAAPLTDAVGFEVAIGGKLFAVCYAGGTRNQIADLSSTGNNTQPTDANAHIYTIYFRGDRVYWCIDGQDKVVASILTGALGPNVNTLPIKFTTIAGTSNPASSAVLTINQTFLADTTGRSTQISDGTFPWRKAVVDANGNQTNTPYPAGAVPITADSGNQANAVATATLAAAAGLKTWLTGFEITAAGSTAATVVTATVTGVVTGTLHYTFVSPAGTAVAASPLIVAFPSPIPSSAVNTAVAVSLPALGAGNTNTTVVAHGFQL